MIRPATTGDAAQLCDIYNHYVLKTPITFEEQAVSVNEMQQRIEQTLQTLPWLVWDEENSIRGFSYASKWKTRCAYRYSVESTVYIRPDASGKGFGSQLYSELLGRLKRQGFHTVIGGIALPNAASVTLHEKFGFEKIAHFRQVGNKFGQWIDVGYWQLILADD